MEYYSAVRRNKILIHKRSQMDFKAIMLSEWFQLYDILEKAKTMGPGNRLWGNVWDDGTVLYPHCGYMTVYMLKLRKVHKRKRSIYCMFILENKSKKRG